MSDRQTLLALRDAADVALQEQEGSEQERICARKCLLIALWIARGTPDTKKKKV